MRVNLQPAYVIHSRPYRDSSSLLDVFTAEYGRIGVVARGTRRQTRRGSGTSLLQPFVPLLLSFSGRSELKTLVATERAQGDCALRKERVFCGMYMNELLVRLLHRDDAHPALFAVYDETLKALVSTGAVDTVLRHFEYRLLEELGYNFDFDVDGASGAPIAPDGWYRYESGVGLVASADAVAEGAVNRRGTYAGFELLAMASGDFGGSARQTAKKLLREALAEHLGGVPLRSRELFRAASRPLAKATPEEPADPIVEGGQP
ncbi:DNA repair protein RecO [Halioglobus japonicus]|nr:DNA repair protein RecO [Halioglobus japonicus]